MTNNIVLKRIQYFLIPLKLKVSIKKVMKKDSMKHLATELLLVKSVSLIKILIALGKIRFNFKDGKHVLLKLFECEKLKSNTHIKEQNSRISKTK